MKKSILGTVAAMAITFLMADADTITIKDKTYDGVYIVQSSTRYIVAFPNDGAVLSFPKNEVDSRNVTITAPDAQRQALRDQWSAKYGAQLAPKQAEQQLAPEVQKQIELENEASSLENKVKFLKAVADQLQESVENLKAEEEQLRNSVSQLKALNKQPKTVAAPEFDPPFTATPPRHSAVAPTRQPVYSSPNVAENGDVKGADNDNDGRAESVYVRGYYRKDGT